MLRDIMFAGRRHFRELQRETEDGIASNVLTSPMHALVAAVCPLVTMRTCARATYSLTAAAIERVPAVEHQCRWVWHVIGPDGVGATWGFEVALASDGVPIRRWGRMGPGPSGLTPAILAQPDKEAVGVG